MEQTSRNSCVAMFSLAGMLAGPAVLFALSYLWTPENRPSEMHAYLSILVIAGIGWAVGLVFGILTHYVSRPFRG
ncbi:MAG: hypothetical protein RL112_415 [Planctomycetota bacterium]